MTIKKLIVGGHGAPGAWESCRRASAWAAVAVMSAAASAWGQSDRQPPDGGPLEDTWQYLVELFRMVVGL